MKMVKSLLLGGAAGVVAVAGAQAADLPVKAKPVEYVKVCSLYGAGFFYIPGTDICIKIGGYVRNQHYWGYSASTATATPFFGSGLNTRSTADDNLYTIRFRTILSVDTRQQTDFGTLRTYLTVGWTQDFPNQTSSQLYANRAFIQFAGFTFGKATSYYDIYSAPATSYFALMASDTGDGGWGVAAYTAQFGNGVSATISAEEARRGDVWNSSNAAVANFSAAPTQSYGDFKFPDIVGNLRIDQGWGSLQVMGAIHDATASYYAAPNTTGAFTCSIGAPAGNTTCGHPDDKIGWAVGVGGILNTNFISPGDKFSFQVNYAEGASRYVNFTQTGATGVPSNYFGSGNNFGFGFNPDAVYGTNSPAGTVGATSLELTKVWGVNAAYDHVWNPKWKTSVYGGYNQTRFNGTAADQICRGFSGALGLGTTFTGASAGCSPNWSMWFVGSRTQWNLTKDFYVGVDVIYTKLNTGFDGLTTGAGFAPGGARPTGVYTFGDQDQVSATFRVHRDFVP